ncbi:MAG: methylmalonyl-CoA mutase family protein, partial [Patescibacteria group bacterium]
WDGVAIDTLADMRDLFDGISIKDVSVSMTINAPAAIFLAMYIALAEERGIPLAKLEGTTQTDILKEYAAQKEWRFPINEGVALVVDMIDYTSSNMPKWHPISVSGYHIREAGATGAQEIAFTLANGIAYVKKALERGLSLEAFAPKFSFFFDVHNDFLEEIAKLRAARVLWAWIMERFGAPRDSRSCWCRIHAQTAGCTLTRNEPLNNIVRVANQAMAAYFGGVQSVHTNSYDEVLCTPTEEAVRIAIRTQQILQLETGISKYADPLGGSYVVEDLTKRMVNEAGAEIQRISDMGGMVNAIEQGYPQRKIRSGALAQEEAYDQNKLPRVGENVFREGPSASEPRNIVLELEKRRGYEQRQLLRLQNVKTTRNETAVRAALEKISERALERKQGKRINMMPSLIEAARAYATIGEMTNAMEKVWGKYMEQEIFSPNAKRMLSDEALKKFHLAYPLRILLAKAGLDGHDRPIYTLAELLKNLGAEVILPGLHCSTDDIAKRALEEDVDVVAISTHIGSPIVLLENIKKKLLGVGKGDALIMGGGIIREHEREELKRLGIEHFFTGGASHENIAQVLF